MPSAQQAPSPAPDSTPTAGLGRIGKYELIAIAGRGNMGIVYRAHDPFRDRDVAIKICAPAPTDSPAQRRLSRRLFFNEALTAGALDHPNIVKIHDAGDFEEEPYIVMEYVAEAVTLDRFCQPETLLPVERAAEIGFHCARALDYAHRRGVVHRDIKPSNILLDAAASVKIGDFGIAQRAQNESTQVLGVMGSPKYMSPEQTREEELTNQTDLYSLGVVLFELLTGRSPYPAKSLAALITSIQHDPIVPIGSLRSGVPGGIEAVVARALERDLARRYSLAGQMAADIAAVLELPADPAPLSEDERFGVVRRLAFFNDFSDAEVWEVIRACIWQRFARGTRILTEGGRDNAFFVIASGSVAVLKGEMMITALAEGDCFGEMGYLARAERTASIVAQEDVALLKINATLMERASVTCQLRFNKQFLRTLIGRLARTSDLLSHRDG